MYMSLRSPLREEELFNPTTPESTYILGFLWGDGNVLEKRLRVQIELVRTDLDKVKPLFETVGKWTYQTRFRPNRQEQASLSTHNRPLSRFLIEKDYLIKSTTTPIKILTLIPNNLKRYFFLGWWDADGCFYRNAKQFLYQCTLAGSYDQDWSEFENLLKTLDITYSIKRRIRNKASKSSTVYFGGKLNTEKFIYFLYPNKFEFGLQRKFDKIKDLL